MVSEKYNANIVFVDIRNLSPGSDESIEILRCINPRNIIVSNLDTYDEVSDFVSFVAKCYPIVKFKITKRNSELSDGKSGLTVVVKFADKNYVKGVCVDISLNTNKGVN